MTTTTKTVAQTLITQLDTALRMLGAHDFIYFANGVQFKVRGSRRASLIVIRLADDDTYTVDGYKGRGGNLRRVAHNTMIHVGSLHHVLADMTGLYTRL